MSSQIDAADKVFQAIMDRKVPVLPALPSDQKLDGENYHVWRVMMLAILESYDLAELVTEAIDRPSTIDESKLSATARVELAQA